MLHCNKQVLSRINSPDHAVDGKLNGWRKADHGASGQSMSETAAGSINQPNPSPSAPAVPVSTPRKLGSLAMVWHYASAYPLHIGAAIAGLTMSSAAVLAIPMGFKLVIDRGFATGNAANIDFYFKLLLGIVVVLAIATSIRFFFVSWLGERTVADIRRAVQRNLLRQAPAFFEDNRPSEISSRMTSDTAIIEVVVGTTLSVALRNIVTGIGGIIYLFYLAPKMAGFIIVGIPVVIMPIMLVGRRLQALSRLSQDRVADVGSITTEVLGAMKIVQGFGQEMREGERFADAVEQTFAAAKRRIIIRSLMTASVIGLIFWWYRLAAVEWRSAGRTGQYLGRHFERLCPDRRIGRRCLWRADRGLWRPDPWCRCSQPPCRTIVGRTDHQGPSKATSAAPASQRHRLF